MQHGTAVSRPHFHAGCVEIGKATLSNLYAEQFAYTYFFPVWELYLAEGNMYLLLPRISWNAMASHARSSSLIL